MALINLQDPQDGLGSSVSIIERTQQFKGAFVTRVGLPTQVVPRFVFTGIEFNTTEYDIGGWFDNSTTPLRRVLTVPDGVSRVRLVLITDFDTTGSFIPSDDAGVIPVKNGATIPGMSGMGYSPVDGRRNRWTMKTSPLDCVPGDEFQVVYFLLTSAAAPDVSVFGTSTNAFGIEAVQGG